MLRHRHGVDCLNIVIFFELSFLNPSFEALIVSIFNLIVVSTWELAHQLGPLRTDLSVQLDKFDIFLNSPLVLDNVWIDSIQPALSALLW